MSCYKDSFKWESIEKQVYHPNLWPFDPLWRKCGIFCYRHTDTCARKTFEAYHMMDVTAGFPILYNFFILDKTLKWIWVHGAQVICMHNCKNVGSKAFVRHFYFTRRVSCVVFTSHAWKELFLKKKNSSDCYLKKGILFRWQWSEMKIPYKGLKPCQVRDSCRCGAYFEHRGLLFSLQISFTWSHQKSKRTMSVVVPPKRNPKKPLLILCVFFPVPLA